jgi:DNA-directed RNA polymerase beta' subunit
MDIKEKGKQYYLNNRDKILEKSKQYYHDNKDKILEKSKQYYHDNKEERQKYNNEYWALHGHIYMQKRSVDQNMKEKRKKYYNDNKDKLLPQSKQYYHDNKESILKYHALTNHIYIERTCARRRQRGWFVSGLPWGVEPHESPSESSGVAGRRACPTCSSR